MEKRNIEKTSSPKIPAWIGLISFLGGLCVFWLIEIILSGTIGSPIGFKGEGLLVALILYIPFRILFRFIYLRRNQPHIEELPKE